ncbi:gluconate 2-dehydrogenase subunit 3 family protein [Paenibacillus sp. H1-7]|uniref:gluconate 2-dehydrogenase subunit 3 family protein n=1 Tax=Paenibacillus sp. H1-7 TaxID=2282849 RepID=UPI001EF86DB6|nr:gluconate 2-dehydrogenase subunit 3 family protein [Paenibacillus sp. H1-7]ULL19376.1 gluconate 2-dehydrogenase subunit 3 family protein [Paenibacillus sp. H1-7]
MNKDTYYPTYDVMAAQHEWDPHTRAIVNERLHTGGDYLSLTVVEAETLRIWCSLLMDDDRGEIIQYVIEHLDRSLSSGVESERKQGLPPSSVLVKSGLEALDDSCQLLYTERFFHLEDERRLEIMTAISSGEATPFEVWKPVPQEAFFRKLLTLTTEAYYSHPRIWSEIGYGGPAYPRGYVRMHPGQLDPWEAKPKYEA